MPSASSSGGKPGNPVFRKLVDAIPLGDRDGTSAGRYSKVSFGRQAWFAIITTPSNKGDRQFRLLFGGSFLRAAVGYFCRVPKPWNDVSQFNVLEAHLFHGFHKKSKLMNGSIPLTPPPLDFEIPDPVVVQLMPNEEIESRKRAPLRLTRQAQHFSNLLDQFLNVKDSQELYLALRAHFERLNRYFERLRGSTEPTEPEE